MRMRRGCETSEPCTPPAKYAHCRYFVRLDWHEKRLVGEGGSAHAFRSVFNSTRLSRFLWLRVCRTYLLVKFCTHLDIVSFLLSKRLLVLLRPSGVLVEQMNPGTTNSRFSALAVSALAAGEFRVFFRICWCVFMKKRGAHRMTPSA
ncbi:unnamed protein product [Ectocarpus sp. 8 AP-2014]